MTGGVLLTLRAPLRGRVDASGVAWSTLGVVSGAVIGSQEVWMEGEGATSLGDLFRIRGTPGSRLRLAGDLDLMDGIGAGWTESELVVEGNAGWDVGRGMRGGTIEVRGSAGPRAGAAEPGAKRGMTGGEIIIRGAAGREAGAWLRRGLIVVEGDADEGAGRAMIAGTVIVFGAVGAGAGLWSKRGSIVAFGPIGRPASYRYACTYRPPHLAVTLTYLRARYGVPVAQRYLSGLYRRYSGDLADIGKGEILEWTSE